MAKRGLFPAAAKKAISPHATWQKPLPAALGGPTELDAARRQASGGKRARGSPEGSPALRLPRAKGSGASPEETPLPSPEAAPSPGAEALRRRRPSLISREVLALLPKDAPEPKRRPRKAKQPASREREAAAAQPHAPKPPRRAPEAAAAPGRKRRGPAGEAAAQGDGKRLRAKCVDEAWRQIEEEEDLEVEEVRPKGAAVVAPEPWKPPGSALAQGETPTAEHGGGDAEAEGKTTDDGGFRPRPWAGSQSVAGSQVGSQACASDAEIEGSAPTELVSGLPCFVATGLELSTRQRRILTDLGGQFTSDWTPCITHLLADTFRRTTKMMCAICCGAHVVRPEYVSACRAAGELVDVEPWLLQDGVCEAAFARKRGIPGGYSLLAALRRAREAGPLLRGVSVYCFPSVTEKRELPLLVASAGGRWLTKFPAERADDDSVLLLAERTVSGEREQQRRRVHHVYDVELLREAACTQIIRRSAYRLR